MKKHIFIGPIIFLLGISILHAGNIKVIYPNGGETLKLNSTVNIRWTSSGVPGKVVIVLYRGGIKFRTISPGAQNTGIFNWRITGNIPAGDRYRIRIRSAKDLSVNDFSDFDFRITPPTK
jgi:hypothetical protein